jgi:tRNA A-37 threonylcarbamoyl transferase component Bud32
MYGVVRETDTGSVIKKGDIGENEVSIQRKLADIKGVPKVLGVEYFPGSARGGEKKGIIEMQKANGTALIDQTSKSDHKVKGAEASKALDEYIRLRKDIHTRGIAHGDMHDANVTWDGKNMGLIDFGSSKEGYKAALAEALGTGGVDHAKYLMSNLKGWGASSPKEEKLQSNFGKVQQKATKKDLTEDEAKKLIEELYDGI